MTPFGLFEYVRMPFGLRNATQTFKRFIDRVLCGISNTYVYIDDILIASSTPKEHLRDLKSVFERLASLRIIINLSKCIFGVDQLDFLGHQVTSQGVAPFPDKVAVIRDFPQPTSPCQLCRFIGMVNFYHRFLHHCTDLMQALHDLLKATQPKSHTLTWNDDAIAAFRNTKEALAVASFLSYPALDVPTCLMTDASDTAVGAVLQQHIKGSWHPIFFFSKRMTSTEKRYSTFDSDVLAVYLAIKHFRHFLEGREFHVFTDHKPLTFALNIRSDCHSPRQAWQLDYISQFTSNIRHIQGSDNPVANAFSRIEINGLLSGQPPTVDYASMVETQSTDPQIQALQPSP